MCDTASVLEEASHSRTQSFQTSRPGEAVSGLWGAEKTAPGCQPRRNRSSRGSANTVRQAPGPSGTNHTVALHSGAGAGTEAEGGAAYRGAGPNRSRVGKSPPGLPGLERTQKILMGLRDKRTVRKVSFWQRSNLRVPRWKIM